jgi:TolA-binding protein
MIRSNFLSVVILAVWVLPGAATAQGSSSYTETRIGQLERAVGDLRGRIEQLRQQNQQLQLQLDKMQSSHESRLQRLERAAPKPPTPRTGQPKP